MVDALSGAERNGEGEPGRARARAVSGKLDAHF